MTCIRFHAPINAIVCMRKPPAAANRPRRAPKRAAPRAPSAAEQLPLALVTPAARPRADEPRGPFPANTSLEATMLYTKADYDAAIHLLNHSGPRGPQLAPSERRTLNQLRHAYVLEVEVPLSDAKLARQLIAAADILEATDHTAEG